MTPGSAASPRYAGAVIVIALILGGGAGQGIWTDHLLELILVPALFFGIAGLWSNQLGTAARILTILVLATIAIQFVPITRTIPLTGGNGLGFWSPAPQKSLDAGLFTTAALGFFLYVSLMSERERARLLPYFYVGLFLQAVVAVVQLSFSRSVTLSGILPFDVTTGLFANENHFSSLFFATIPLLAYTMIVRAESMLGFVALSLVMVGILFAVGSRAGMGISSASAVLSLIWFAPVGNKLVARIGALFVGVFGLLTALWAFGSGSSLEGDQRWVIFETTWEAIGDHWLLGSGLGTFTLVYPAYEEVEQVMAAYVNHAHNDFLEIMLELGLTGTTLLLGYFALLLRGAFRSGLSEAAFLSVVALCIHSILDYPLRTMALAITLGYLSSVVLSHKDDMERDRNRPAT
ncbi:O-antigen ligase family protein [Oricola indica]|uniref:O-antigen ligase family protein n=1 Tax=Oricola indica TaxID=2872591 RepID=UPI003CCBA26A